MVWFRTDKSINTQHCNCWEVTRALPLIFNKNEQKLLDKTLTFDEECSYLCFKNQTKGYWNIKIIYMKSFLLHIHQVNVNLMTAHQKLGT